MHPNDKLVSSSSNTYLYRAYIEMLVNYGMAAKKTQLTAAGWYKDIADAIDSFDIAGDNTGLAKRAALASKIKTIDLVGRRHSDIFFQEKLFLNRIGIQLKLHKNKDTAVIMANKSKAAYRAVIFRTELRVRKVRVSSVVILSHAKALEQANAKYPLNRV